MAEQVQSYNSYHLFGGLVRNINTTLGINQNPTVVTISVVKDRDSIIVANRQLVHIQLGAFDFRGIVQSWSQAKEDITGKDIYQIRITDTKTVLNAASVIIGSSFNNNNRTVSESYGDNVISILPENASQIVDGISFTKIKTAIESYVIKYGSLRYQVKFNFTLPSRGSAAEYSLSGRALSLLELISQIGDDHGLDWFVTTSGNNVIFINMYGRTNITDKTVNQLAALHQGDIIKRHEGEENRDAIQRVVLVGGHKTRLSQQGGSQFQQFWGASMQYSRSTMEDIINGNFTSEQYTEDSANSILSYANEFWGRKFISSVGSTILGSDGKSWVVPTSAGWWEGNGVPEGLSENGSLKFQTDDGRWVTFVVLGLPGNRYSYGPGAVSYEWGSELYSNPNTLISHNTVYMKASLEITTAPNGGEYFIITTATPLRVLTSTTTKDDDGNKVITVTRTRAESLRFLYLAVMDQRLTYGPWTNSNNAVGRADVVIDSSLTPWTFGYRGIGNTIGFDSMNRVARAKIKTVTDTTMDAKTVELEVAGLPKMNLGDQLQETGAITSIQIVFAINGVRTTYKSLQYTNDLSKHLRAQQDLLDSLRRRAAEFNNKTTKDLELDRAVMSLKKDIPELPIGSEDDRARRELKTVLGRILESSHSEQPKYNITPMAWVSSKFGELSLVRDPKVLGNYYDVVNMSEKQTAQGRLAVGKDVQVQEFSVTDGGVVSYYIDVAVPKTAGFKATIDLRVSNSQPTYRVVPVENKVQELLLTEKEGLSLNEVLNIGEPANFRGYLDTGAEVMVNWNENSDGSFTPFIEQQVNLFLPES